MDLGRDTIWEQQLDDPITVDVIAQALDLDVHVGRILVQRGIRTAKDAKSFIQPVLEQLHNPLLLPDASIAIDRLLAAIEKGERIAIHGDYDVDGVTATVLIRRVFELMGADVSHYIPHRMSDGYGLTIDGINRLHNEGAKVVVTVDCGIRSLEAAERAREIGIDLLVTDHHEPGDVLPRAVAVINPRRNDSKYPCRDLSGAGIAFKIAQALCIRTGNTKWLSALLKIAAIGTVADVVPLVGENRVIASLGLDALTAGGHTHGLQALLDVSGLDGRRVESEDISFRLAPRINAAGRMSSAGLAADLLLSAGTSSVTECRALAEHLDELNTMRREQERQATNTACDAIDAEAMATKRPCHVVWSNEWHRGVIGIIASRLVERFRRPAIVISVEGDQAYGSGRSIPGFDLLGALNDCEGVLTQYGGHRHAVGLRLQSASIPEFRSQFERSVGTRLVVGDCVPKLTVDSVIDFAAITAKFVRDLQLLEPFGSGNPRPVFVASGVEIVDGPHLVKSEHLRMTLGQAGKRFQAVAWRAGSQIADFNSRRNGLKIAFTVAENTYKDKTTTQLTIAGVKEDD
ncbi:MAG: single-stranded-DNA-specific exonuclease RecJ [Acidobacteriota bacterium]|nr:single-stranded-DNA-specific exonuclease RecJ [Acidobacteriota bacterium]